MVYTFHKTVGSDVRTMVKHSSVFNVSTTNDDYQIKIYDGLFDENGKLIEYSRGSFLSLDGHRLANFSLRRGYLTYNGPISKSKELVELIFDVNSALAEISIDDIEFEPEPEPVVVVDDPIEEPEMNEEEPIEEPEVVEEPTE